MWYFETRNTDNIKMWFKFRLVTAHIFSLIILFFYNAKRQQGPFLQPMSQRGNNTKKILDPKPVEILTRNTVESYGIQRPTWQQFQTTRPQVQPPIQSLWRRTSTLRSVTWRGKLEEVIESLKRTWYQDERSRERHSVTRAGGISQTQSRSQRQDRMQN